VKHAYLRAGRQVPACAALEEQELYLQSQTRKRVRLFQWAVLLTDGGGGGGGGGGGDASGAITNSLFLFLCHINTQQ